MALFTDQELKGHFVSPEIDVASKFIDLKASNTTKLVQLCSHLPKGTIIDDMLILDKVKVDSIGPRMCELLNACIKEGYLARLSPHRLEVLVHPHEWCSVEECVSLVSQEKKELTKRRKGQ